MIGPCARTLELPLLVRSGVFCFFLSQGQIFSVFSTLFYEEVSDYKYTAYGPLIRIFMVTSDPVCIRKTPSFVQNGKSAIDRMCVSELYHARTVLPQAFKVPP